MFVDLMRVFVYVYVCMSAGTCVWLPFLFSLRGKFMDCAGVCVRCVCLEGDWGGGSRVREAPPFASLSLRCVPA